MFEQISKQVKTTYLDYKKIKGFEDVGYFLKNYVVSGGEVTKDITENNKINVATIVVVLNNDVQTREGTSFKSKIPNTTYYLDFTEGDFIWGTSHPSGVAGVDYLTIAEVTTDANKNVLNITDTRGPVGGFRLKSDYGLEELVDIRTPDPAYTPERTINVAGDIIRDMQAQFAKYVFPIFNVKAFGAKGDGVTDDAAAIQAAINAVAAVGGGTVYFPDGDYLTGLSLSVFSNVHLKGDASKPVIRDHPNLGANRIFYIVGTPENRIQNITFEDLTIQNGLASTDTYTTGKDGIRCEYVDGLTINRCKITEIQGAYGVVTKYTKNILVQNCEFYRWTYSGMTVLVECENIKILDNTFDTALAQNTPQNYTFATGGEALGEGEFFVKNLWIERNKFLNNPRWEGIDSHGGENIWIKDNYVENCKIGVMCGLATGFVSSPVLKNVYIEDNVIVQGNGENDQSGIVVNGEVGKLAENVIIKGNKINGFGGTTLNTVGSITVYYTNNLIIENNDIDDYAQSAVMLYHTVWGAKIVRNYFRNCRGGGSPTITAGITFRAYGIYDVTVEENVQVSSDSTKIAKHFIRNGAGTRIGAIQIKNNSVLSVETSTYSQDTALPVIKTSAPTASTQKFGDVIYKNTGNPGWYVSAPEIGMGSQVTGVIVTVNMTAGSNIATIAANGTRSWEDLPPGMNITIAGAGAEGANLNARILENDGTNLTLNVAASTTVSGANLTYQGITLQAV